MVAGGRDWGKWGRTANGYRVSLWGDDNVPKFTVVTVAKLNILKPLNSTLEVDEFYGM